MDIVDKHNLEPDDVKKTLAGVVDCSLMVYQSNAGD